MEGPRPPKPRLTLRVGVTGHRLEALEKLGFDEATLRASIREVLTRIHTSAEEIFERNRDVYSEEPPILRIVSPLAEGSDRLVAAEALKLGTELHCPLPFTREEYAKDFPDTNSQAEFADLLSQATRIFELDGPADRRDEAYEMVGRTVLRQSDILIAIWDQEQPFGIGGTGQIAQEATSLGIPVVWIDPKSSKPLALWEATPRQPGARKDISLLRKRLKSLIEFPESHKEMTAYRRFLCETQPKWNQGLFYKFFCKLWVWDWPSPRLRVPVFLSTAHAAWENTWRTLDLAASEPGRPTGTTHPLATGLISPFAWADGLAEFYANKYRSSFVSTYLMGALAILFAYIGSQHHSDTLTLMELVFIFSIVVITAWGRRQGWHQRWMEYRSLAEDFRQMQFLALLGRTLLSAVSIPTHVESGDPINKWFNWYARALSRQTGLIQARLDDAYLESYRQVLESSLRSQLAYHENNEYNYRRLSGRLKLAAHALFVLTFLFCAGHLFYPFEASIWVSALTFGTIVFPAFAGAFGAILHSGEFERIATRSEDLKIRLGSLAWQSQHMRGGESSKDLGLLAHSLAETARSELAAWRFTVMDKDLNLPA